MNIKVVSKSKQSGGSCYIGSNLIVDKYGEFPSMDNFFDLLTKPVLPSDLI